MKSVFFIIIVSITVFLFPDDGKVPPWVPEIEVNDSLVTLLWESYTGATKYYVYSSQDPYGIFHYEIETTDTTWIDTISDNLKFYIIVASNDSIKNN